MPSIKRAVVIGINDYKDEEIPALAGAVHDATEMRKILTDYGDFQIKDDHFLTDGRATCANIRSAVSDLFWSTDEPDIALFYFSGHGLVDHNEFGYLLPHDAEKLRPFASSFRIQELKTIFAMGSPLTTRLMVLDCCYSGIATKGVKAAVADDLKMINHEVSLSEHTGSGRYILASAEADSTSREEELDCPFGGGKHAHGQFTYRLIEGLNTLGCEETLYEISLDVLIKHLNKTKGTRNPQLNASAASLGEVVLTRNPEQHKQALNKRVKEIERLIDLKRIQDTVVALNQTQQLHNKLAAQDEQQLTWAIHTNLKGWSDRLDSWYYDNVDTLSQLSGLAFYKIFNDAIRNVEADHLLTQPAGIRVRLAAIMGDILEGKTAEYVTAQIRKADAYVAAARTRTESTAGILPEPLGPKNFASKI